MTIKQAKTLKWGDYIVPSELHRTTFVQGKKIVRGIFLGLKKDGHQTLLRVVTQDGATVYYYHPDLWKLHIDNTTDRIEQLYRDYYLSLLPKKRKAKPRRMTTDINAIADVNYNLAIKEMGERIKNG